MLRYVKVSIRRSELATVQKDMPMWELPLVESIFPSGVEVLEEFYLDGNTPKAQDEYERLNSVYRQSVEDDGSRGIAHVAAVYGQFGPGTQALRRAIAENTVAEVPEGARVAKIYKRVKIGDLF